jgi:prepilin signal peptidase PulO-like enzyme (type II secretory pathway)
MLLAILFILGAHVGSFLNVCIWRLPRGESVVEPPSHCPKCNARLKMWDMVPILSQALLRSRCRYCKAPYSWRYAGIEALTGALFVCAGLRPGAITGGYLTGIWTGDAVILARDLVVISCLVVVFWIDLETFMIPISSALLIGLAGVGADVWGVYSGTKPLTTAPLGFFDVLPAALPESLAAMALTAALLWLLRAVASWMYGREAMGFGDVILVAGIGACIGWNIGILTFFFLSAVLGAFIGLVLRVPHAVRAYRWGKARDKRAKQREAATKRKPLASALARRAFRLEMPFGPMLAVGAFVTILFGPWLTNAYVDWAAPGLNDDPNVTLRMR